MSYEVLAQTVKGVCQYRRVPDATPPLMAEQLRCGIGKVLQRVEIEGQAVSYQVGDFLLVLAKPFQGPFVGCAFPNRMRPFICDYSETGCFGNQRNYPHPVAFADQVIC